MTDLATVLVDMLVIIVLGCSAAALLGWLFNRPGGDR